MPNDLAATGGADITNEYLNFGLTAGLGAIILFIVLLTRSFSSLGKALAETRLVSSETTREEFIFWGLGGMLVVHIINWFGIIYFDQMYVIWFMQLAAITTLSFQPVKVNFLPQSEATVDETVNLEYS